MKFFLIAAWEIWKLRNAVIFEGVHPTFHLWTVRFKDQVQLQLHRFKHDRASLVRTWLTSLWFNLCIGVSILFLPPVSILSNSVLTMLTPFINENWSAVENSSTVFPSKKKSEFKLDRELNKLRPLAGASFSFLYFKKNQSFKNICPF